MDEPIELTPVQEMAARAIWLIEHNDPPCSVCGSGVLRPNCALDYDLCPRHEAADKLHDVIYRIEKFGGLRDIRNWRYRSRLMQIVGPPTEDDIKTLRWLADKGGKFVSPKHTDTFDSPVLRACGYWSTQYNNWTFRLSERGLAYLEEVNGSKTA